MKKASFILLFLCFSVNAIAQNSGRIVGKVIDDRNETLPGVQVFIEGTTRGTITLNDGFYDMINVPAGVYTLVFKYIGFADVRVNEVEVIVGRTTTIDVVMQESVFEGEEIVVVAERPIVQRDRTTTTAFLSSRELEVLPVKSVAEAINLQAGVVDGHFRGGRLNEVAYIVNGVPINNPFTNTPGFTVEQNMVANLEVITGIFNAEFGQATSGVVNIATKGPPRKWSLDVLGYSSAIVSTREMEFVRRDAPPGSALSINDFSTERVSYLQASPFPQRTELNTSIGGPIIPDRLGFNVNLRYINDQGRFIGRRLFNVEDYSGNASTFQSTFLLNPNSPDEWIIRSTGDGKFVSMSENERFSVNTSLMFDVTRELNLNYNGFFQTGRFRNFNHWRKYVPDGRNWNYPLNQTHILGSRYTFSANTFANLSYSFQRDEYESRLYNDPLDPRLLSESYLNQTGPYTFSIGGNDIFYTRNITQIHRLVGSVTSQVNRVHQVKGGFLLSLQNVNDRTIGIDIESSTGYVPVQTSQAWRNQNIRINPLEAALYIQDKIELDYLIINAGLRFDYFDPDFLVPIEWGQAGREYIIDVNSPGDSLYNRRRASAKYQLSPRLGIAFPISERSVLRFSYGMFFQTPNYNQIYVNPNYIVNPLADATRYGNADINPQKTSTFEVGYQQGLSDFFGLELTLYIRDIRNLLADEIERDITVAGSSIRYVNREYGTVRGITLSVFQRPMGAISWTLDYTLQFADGSYAISGELAERIESGLEETLTLARLDWDRRHVINHSLSYVPNRRLTATVINRFNAGRPYTTSRGGIRSFIRNNEDRPVSLNTDIRVYFTPAPEWANLSLFLQIDNLFDAKNVSQVYADTGSPTETREKNLNRNLRIQGINSINDYFYRQDHFSAPRFVNVGVRLRI